MDGCIDVTEQATKARERPIRHQPVQIDETRQLKVNDVRLDRLKFSLPKIIVSPTLTPAVFFGLLKRGQPRCGNPIAVGSRGRKTYVEFGSSHWYFSLRATFEFSNEVWSGAGSLELNPIRLFASIIPKRDLYREPSVVAGDLVRNIWDADQETLDKSDNYIPAKWLGFANAIDWPSFCQTYVDAVLDFVHSVFGETSLPSNPAVRIPVARLAPPHEWVIREVEVCFEFHDEDAISRVGMISGIALGLAREYHEANYGEGRRNRLREDVKTVDMRSVRIGAGVEDVEIAIYAKAVDRVRLEVRYKARVLKSCRLTQSDFRLSTRFIELVLIRIVENATKRANKFLGSYRAAQATASAGAAPLSRALSYIAEACIDHPGVLHHILSLLIQNNGVAATKNPNIQSVIDRLVEDGVLSAANMALRSTAKQYVLSPAYIATFTFLRTTNFNGARLPLATAGD